ncbi:YkvA family protein [Brevundimonas diminuta]|uniref:YkvA family protein n=1 Tax=Brevundimonas TaxID=41275 RepID=UPI0022AF984F|nr:MULTISPECIES: YkvA family protein [Brevundimonas]MCZ4106888.1 YkvA family protein [Brevundimonas diminuta]
MTAKTNGVSPDDAINPEKALVPAVQKVNEMRVRKGFWPKMRRTAARIPFAGQALAAWYATQDPKTPLAAKGLILGALAYFVMPVDAIPDIFAGIGFTDDAAVIAAVLATLGAHLKPRHHDQAAQALKRLREDEEE